MIDLIDLRTYHAACAARIAEHHKREAEKAAVAAGLKAEVAEQNRVYLERLMLGEVTVAE